MRDQTTRKKNSSVSLQGSDGTVDKDSVALTSGDLKEERKFLTAKDLGIRSARDT